MKKLSVALLVCSILLLTACTAEKKEVSAKDSSAKQETVDLSTKKSTKISKMSSSTSESKTTTSTSFASVDPETQGSVESQSAPVESPQEESYDQLKQRTLQSVPSDRVNWSSKEWEAFGMALSENGLAMDDNGYIISQAQKDEAEKQKEESQDETQGRSVTSIDQAVQIAQSQFGDNNGAWTWGPMGEVDDGYFVKAYDPNDGTMTHTAKSVIVHYDGSVTEN